MSGEFLKRQSVVHDTPAEIFGIAAVRGHVLSATASSDVVFSPVKLLAANALDDDTRKPQVFSGVHRLGCHHVCASADGNRAATAGFGGEVKVWEWAEAEGWKPSINWKGDFSPGEAWAIAMSSDGNFLASTSFNGEIIVRSVETNDLVRSYETKGQHGLCIDMSADGQFTASGHQDGGIFIFNNDANRLLHPLTGSTFPIRSVSFSPLGTLLAAAGDGKSILIFDTVSGEQVSMLTGHSGFITALSWNSTGTHLLSASFDSRAKVWDIGERECVATIRLADKRLWAARWLPKTRGHEGFVVGGAAKEISVYEEVV